MAKKRFILFILLALTVCCVWAQLPLDSAGPAAVAVVAVAAPDLFCPARSGLGSDPDSALVPAS